MKTSISSLALLSAAGLAAAQSDFCPEALRFGRVALETYTLVPGNTVWAWANLSCAVQLGYTPKYVDYYLEPLNYSTSSTDNADLPIMLSRSQLLDVSVEQPIYNTSFVVPHAQYAYTNYTLAIWEFVENIPPYLNVGGLGDVVTIAPSA